jgi:hypothetical protein
MTNLLKNSALTLLILISPSNLLSSELKVISDSVPYEVELMFDHIKSSNLSSQENELLSANLDLLNDDLSSLNKRNLLFLFKSEIYKGIFTNQYLKTATKLQLSIAVINTTKKKIETNKVIYTKYSLWTIQSILNDLSPFMENNFLNRYQNINRGNVKDVLKAKKLSKVFKYVSPLLGAFLDKSPEEFNILQKSIILDTFSRIALKSFYFQTLYIKGATTDSKLFSLPKKMEKEPMPPKLSTDDMTLKDESRSKKEEAVKVMDSIGSDEMSSASKAIDEIEQKSSN